MKRFAIAILVWLIAAEAVAQSRPAPEATFFPVEVGTRWLYRAHVKWTVEGTNEVREADVDWPVEVIRSVARCGWTAALLRGFPDDLAWYEPGQQPRPHTILQIGSAVYRISDERAANVFARAETARAEKDFDEVLRPDDLWFRVPLKDGSSFCPPDHPANLGVFYCWHVEGTVAIGPDALPGAPPAARTGFELWYQSNPDHQIYTLVSGIGISHYTFAHHGTTAEAEAQLVRIVLPRKRAAPPKPPKP